MNPPNTVLAHLPGPMVQMMVVTINGTQYALIGPVVHGPDATEQDPLNITEIHFGEILPASVAAEMLNGSFLRQMENEVQ